MIKDITVNAVLREQVGKGATRRLRAQGLVPVAVYGENEPAATVSLTAREIGNILRSGSGHNTIFKLNIPGMEVANVIIKDFQLDPVKGRIMHADLLRLSMTTVTRVYVAVELLGEPAGVKTEGGILEIELRQVEVECLPGDIPEKLQAEVGALHIGEHVSVSDLIYDREKVKVLSPAEQIVAGVLAPRMVEEAAPAAEVVEPGAGTEPEVIKKGKGDEGE
ncbi:MAG TPA: 50S ribosomal protein L25 [Blastocatellia bacterium]|nr:50S ribosomal protein L25 [Blastocatellia bacterium]